MPYPPLAFVFVEFFDFRRRHELESFRILVPLALKYANCFTNATKYNGNL
jgi:hypothetical protein